MKLLEVSRITPANTAAADTELTHPLSFLDLFFFKLPPVGRLFFYSVPGLDRTRFNDSVLPKLKDSLALTLLHYLPLAGKILWPPSSLKPLLCYRPGDAVSLSVSESESDFHHLSGNLVRDTAEFRRLTADLPVSHDQASIFSVNITLFPTAGFCIGTSVHHAILDGKSSSMFMKSWAHICKNLIYGSAEPTLPPELRPVFDRTAIEENNKGLGFDLRSLRHWTALTETLSEGNPRSLLLMKEMKTETDDSVLCTFELTPANIETLRNRVMKTEHYVSGTHRLSTFVLATAYISVHKLKFTALSKPSGDGEENRAIIIGIPVDYRTRLKLPTPANYIGNCAMGHKIEMEAREVDDGDGFARVAVKLSEAVRELEKGVDLAAELSLPDITTVYSDRRVIGMTGSNRFGVYTADFGWGTPEKVAVQIVDRNELITMADGRDGSGGVEMSLVLTELELPHFQALFADGLTSP